MVDLHQKPSEGEASMYQPNVPCAEYRGEQRLLALRRQLQDPALDPSQRRQIEEEAAELERLLKMD